MSTNYIFIPDYSGGGAEKLFLDFAKYTKDNNFPTIIITLSEEGSLRNWCNENCLKVVSLKIKNSRWKWFFFPLLLFRFVRLMEPGDKVLSAMFYCNLMSVIGSFFKPIKCIASQHTVKSVEDRMKPFWIYLIIKYVTKFVHTRSCNTICVSRSVKNDLINNYSVSADKLVVIYNPVAILPSDKSIHQIKKSYENREKLNLLCVGRLVNDKGFDFAIKATQLIKYSGIDVTLNILGDGEKKAELCSLAKCYGVGENVVFHGFIKDLSCFYSSSHIILVPSRLEGFGNVVVEGLSYGKPVIVSDCPGGLTEIICEDEFGSIVSLSEDEISNKIIYWYQSDTIELASCRMAKSRYYLPENLFPNYLKLF